MNGSPRQQFLSYVRNPTASMPIVSPFLPHQDVIQGALQLLGLPVSGEAIRDEVALARELGYQPMFMTECSSLIFNWKTDELRSSQDLAFRVIHTHMGDWTWQAPRKEIPWSDEADCPVKTVQDHAMLIAVCEQAAEREGDIREYYRTIRRNVGEDGVIVLGHPHPSWLGFQITPTNIFYQWNEFPDVFVRSMDALAEASLFVMSIAFSEGIDFMSDSSYGLEMTSPQLFMTMDLPYIQKFADWTHQRDGLFWYHNCGFTSQLIKEGIFNSLGADVIETIAPPPEGDNNLAESRRHIDRRICTKGNLNLRLLRDGSPDEIRTQVQHIVSDVKGYSHIISTADAVLPGTKPENFVAFVTAARAALGLQ
jgi:hypothetical protein